MFIKPIHNDCRFKIKNICDPGKIIQTRSPCIVRHDLNHDRRILSRQQLLRISGHHSHDLRRQVVVRVVRRLLFSVNLPFSLGHLTNSFNFRQVVVRVIRRLLFVLSLSLSLGHLTNSFTFFSFLHVIARSLRFCVQIH